jgi:hypothetical protein
MFIPCLIHIVCLPWCIDSPKYLFIIKNKPDEAKKCNFCSFFTFMYYRNSFGVVVKTVDGLDFEERYSRYFS